MDAPRMNKGTQINWDHRAEHIALFDSLSPEWIVRLVDAELGPTDHPP